ncbi:hypothetical protein [Microbacterium dauci]|uniref:Nitrate/sulfonate/bicarbonate ABC transporter periplasmic protein n=1 Tax=Microbacterium dauci TaxID=3048008 RepID=A0ABT6ZBM6_9MICO|nr:hypothetical protein [Microbacterium sp. LX3-4]MDJ1113559.1 hypothetical protein [Microbacterium sp. LX3-4]
MPRRFLVAAGTFVLAALIAGCSPQTPGGTASQAPGDAALGGPASDSATPTPAPTVDPASVTCENMLAADAAAEFAATDWSVREDPFVILDLELPDGTACTWGDFSSPTSDDLVLFGWSPIDDADAASVQTALLEEGWVREDDGDDVILTEDPASALRLDADGYGMTYRFESGAVTVSDTKQGLDLIDVQP